MADAEEVKQWIIKHMIASWWSIAAGVFGRYQREAASGVTAGSVHCAGILQNRSRAEEERHRRNAATNFVPGAVQ